VATYTYEIPVLLSIDADTDAEARAIAEEINTTTIGRVFFDDPFMRTNIETSVTEVRDWPKEDMA